MSGMASDRSHAVADVLRTLEGAGLGLRTLAKEAGVDASLLFPILSGEHAATPAVADAIATVLERWAARCAEGAKAIRGAQEEPREH